MESSINESVNQSIKRVEDWQRRAERGVIGFRFIVNSKREAVMTANALRNLGYQVTIPVETHFSGITAIEVKRKS
jgi:hypothetical protein